MESADKEPESLAQIQFETLAGMRGSAADRLRVARQLNAERHARERAEKLASEYKDWRNYIAPALAWTGAAALLAASSYLGYRIGFDRGTEHERAQPKPIEQQIQHVEALIRFERLQAASEADESRAPQTARAKRLQDLQAELEHLRQSNR